MTQLEDCYFCGTVEDPLESYPVIPPETYPPEDAQRTVVLCPTCRQKLGRVLDPLVEYLDSPTADGEREGGNEIEGAGDGGTEADAPERQADDGAHEQRMADTGEQLEDEREDRVEDERDGENEPETGSDTGTRERPAELPDGTRKIVRLLRNREFPVERGDVVTVAANAYEIRREEANAAVDALVEHGWLIERGGQLHRAD
jgi:hypothetical protein